MNIAGISATDYDTGLAGQGNSSLDKDAFMQLLVAQMRNQDPTQPADSEQLAAQLAQFSSLEQLEQINENLTVMGLLEQNNALLSQLSESSSLIGNEITWEDPELGISGSGTVDSVQVINGLTYLKVDGNSVPLAFVTGVQAAGSTDGEATDEADAADGADDEQGSSEITDEENGIEPNE
jgi:flagellar basal-body rod modification protein FlgD